MDECCRHAARRALDQHRLAGPESRLGEEGAVGGQPCCAEDRGMKGRQAHGQGDRVPLRHNRVVGKCAVDELAGDVPLWIERLVPAPVLAPHHRVDDDWRAVVEGASRVVAQDDRVGDPFGVPAHSAQREQVVAVQAGVADPHAHPPVGHVRVGPLADH